MREWSLQGIGGTAVCDPAVFKGLAAFDSAVSKGLVLLLCALLQSPWAQHFVL